MLVGQKVGQFLIDKELGSGAMGSVYRGIDRRTGRKVAIKIMAQGLASNTQSIRRFEREFSILKQFKHRNIVRFYCAGEYQSLRYFAMEYIEGEALDRVMARRGRMSWEDVVALGKQLCAALQHAHEKEVVHRDLKPSNLMILRDGTLKLTDFGIAKDLDVTQLTEQNCTVGTAAYMSPEQCKGEKNLTHKSDLYSLGVVFYELLTGKKPFIADNAMDMFMLHVQGQFKRPGQIVDIPVWLDNLVCQLLEKKPEHRPYNATTVASALTTIQEKVEAQKSAGVDAKRQKRLDRLSNQPLRPVVAHELDGARPLLGKKSRKKKGVAFYRTGWFVGLSVAAVLGSFALGLWLMLRPASPEALYAEARTLMESKNPEDWDRASKGPIKTYLANYASRPGEQTAQMRQWLVDIDVYANEQLLMRYLSKKKAAIKFDHQSDAEKWGFKGIDAEEDGDLKEARKDWTEMQTRFGSGSGFSTWGRLAEAHLKMLDNITAMEKSFRKQYDELFERARQPRFDTEEEKDTFLAFWYEWFGDPFMARSRFVDLREQYAKDPEKRFWAILAAGKNRELKEFLKGNPTAERDRPAVVEKKLAEAATAKIDKAYGIYWSIAVLYENEVSMKLSRDQALEGLRKLDR